MNAGDAWVDRMREAAPSTPTTFLRLLAIALEGLPSEGLILVTEALREDATAARLCGREWRARDLDALADLVGREVAWRSPTLSLPRRT